MLTFTSKEVCERLKLKERTLRKYVTIGAVLPYSYGAGPGTKHIFSNENIKEIERFLKIVSQGVSIETASRIVYRNLKLDLD